MAVDISTVPPFIIFQKPLFCFSPKVSRVYVDEVGNDVVVISASVGEVAFYHLSLRDGDSVRDTTAEAATADVSDVSWLRHHPYLPADAIALTVKGRQVDGVILHAKRCPTPVRDMDGNRAHLVALSFDTRAVFFFLCQRRTGSLPLTAVTMFRCSPRNLRFREDCYPIQTFYWIAEHKLQWTMETPHEQEQQQQFCGNDDSTLERSPHQMGHESLSFVSPSSSSRRTIVCITTISIDLVAIDEVTPQPSSLTGHGTIVGDRAWVLLRRYPTHTDYWHYNPAVRMLLSVNKLKPTVVKLFEVSKESFHTLRKVHLGESCLATTEEESKGRMPFYSAASMDAPPFHGSIGVLALNRSPFLCFISPSDGCACLYRYTKVDADGIVAQSGQFVRYATLQADFRLNPWRDPIALQIIDNLVVLHALERKLTCCFDIMCNEEPTTSSSHSQCNHRGGMIGARESSNEDYPPPSHITPRSSAECGSWITRLANGIRRNSSAFLQTSNAEGGVHVTTDPVFCPLLSASLALHPMAGDTITALSSMCDAAYAHDFINSVFLPLALNRTSGTVCLTYINPFATAAAMPHGAERVRFYLNRVHCAGSAVPSMLRAMLSRQESLVTVAECFAVVVMHDVRQRALADPARSFASSPTCFVTFPTPRVATSDLLGSAPAIRRCLHAADEDGLPLPQGPPWRGWGGLTVEDIMAVCTATTDRSGKNGASEDHAQVKEGGGQQKAEGMEFDESIGQLVVLRWVFAPLVNSVFPSDDNDDDDDSAKSPIDACDTATRFFARYLYHAILEYARCVMHTGDTLNEGIQRLLLRLLPIAAVGHQGMRQLLLPGIISDTVPMALRLLRMPAECRQLGLDILARLRADTALVQELLVKRRPLDAARHALMSGKCDAQVLGDVLRVAMDVAREEGTKGALEFITVYEMIAGWLLSRPIAPETVPAELVPATAEYQRMLMSGNQID